MLVPARSHEGNRDEWINLFDDQLDHFSTIIFFSDNFISFVFMKGSNCGFRPF